jgi:hypothetical protein
MWITGRKGRFIFAALRRSANASLAAFVLSAAVCRHRVGLILRCSHMSARADITAHGSSKFCFVTRLLVYSFVAQRCTIPLFTAVSLTHLFTG